MASKVQALCIKVMFKKGNIGSAVKLAVMANLQPGNKGLFINEARADAEASGMTALQYAGGLSALTAKGFYTPSQDPEYKGKYGYWSNPEQE